MEILAAHERMVVEHGTALRYSTIHNDPNDYNVLVDKEVSGSTMS